MSRESVESIDEGEEGVNETDLDGDGGTSNSPSIDPKPKDQIATTEERVRE